MVNTENNTNDFWFWLAIIIAAAGLAMFYLLNQVLLVRVVILLSSVVIGVFVALKSDRGKRVLHFLQETKIELKKVVWPTRLETVKMTVTIIIAVILFALFLWMIDSILFYLIKLVV